MIDYIYSLFDDGTVASWFTFDPSKPLLFNSGLFLAFFFIFYIIYVRCRYVKFDSFRKLYLIAFSMFFYYKAGGFSLSIAFFGFVLTVNYAAILLICALVTDRLARVMYKEKLRGAQRVWLFIIIAINLIMLAYFKYTGFLFDNINSIFGSDFSFTSVILPIGISFYVFEAISYAVDLYRKEMKPAETTLDFCFYISFFPKLVAGPIIRAKDFLPQMKERLYLTRDDANKALFLIIIGLIKKAVISDYISSNFVDRVFDSPLTYTSFENLMAVYGYSIQIYCDFSGYSDIAIGLALLMGFKIPPNFNMPYKAQSITEFWRRWHISLSTWLRDYLYISLGGNRKGKIRTYINLFITMLIGGLWHGASWKFVVWGGLHGAFLVIERAIRKIYPLSGTSRWGRAVRILITFHLVSFCWIFFRAESFTEASKVISSIGNLKFSLTEWGTIIVAYRNVFVLIIIGYLMHFIPDRMIDKVQQMFGKVNLIGQACILGLVMWLIYATMSSGPQPFIYFQF